MRRVLMMLAAVAFLASCNSGPTCHCISIAACPSASSTSQSCGVGTICCDSPAATPDGG